MDVKGSELQWSDQGWRTGIRGGASLLQDAEGGHAGCVRSPLRRRKVGAGMARVFFGQMEVMRED